MDTGVVLGALVAATNAAFTGKDGEDWFEGLIPTLAEVDAGMASQPSGPGRSSVAAHLRHLVYTLEVVNVWFSGQHPELDWRAAWQQPAVTPEEWEALKERLEIERRSLEQKLLERQEPSAGFIESAASNLAHLGYHVGAIRQILLGLGAER